MQINRRKSAASSVKNSEISQEVKLLQGLKDELESENKSLRQKLAECVDELQLMTKANGQLKKTLKHLEKQQKPVSDNSQQDLLEAHQQIEALRESKELADRYLDAKKRVEQANRKLIEENLVLRVDAHRHKKGPQLTSTVNEPEVNRLNQVVANKEVEIKKLEEELNERIQKQSQDSLAINDKIAQLVNNRTIDIQQKLARRDQKIRSLEHQLNQQPVQSVPIKKTSQPADQEKADIAQVMLEAKDIANQLIMRANFDIKKSTEKFEREKAAYQEDLVFLKEKLFVLESETRYLLEKMLIKTDAIAKVELVSRSR